MHLKSPTFQGEKDDQKKQKRQKSIDVFIYLKVKSRRKNGKQQLPGQKKSGYTKR